MYYKAVPTILISTITPIKKKIFLIYRPTWKIPRFYA